MSQGLRPLPTTQYPVPGTQYPVPNPRITVALAGDTMLGRMVGERLADPSWRCFSPELVEVTQSADLVVLNLECCISERGEPYPDPGKPFFFRAPPRAVEVLAELGTGCVTLANNHALDFGEVALLDTLDLLDASGIARTGAGPDLASARAPALLEASGLRLAVIGCSDHPTAFAATEQRPGIAHADLGRDPSSWLLDAIGRAGNQADVILVSPHWGPNMVAQPVRRVAAAGPKLVTAGAALVAGHSAHVFHGVTPPILWDLGDLVDDYAVDPKLRNDLGLLWLVTMDAAGPIEVEAVPLQLGFCHTRLAAGEEAEWIIRRLRQACAALGTGVTVRTGHPVVAMR